jgi:predicted metal-dependent peptidase
VVFIIDTSGSIGLEDYKTFVSEIKNVNKICELDKCRIMQCHTSVSSDDKKFKMKKINSIEFKESGGTRMRSALDILAKEGNRKPVVLFTDGYIDDFRQSEFQFKILMFLTDPCNKEELKKKGFRVICLK